MTSDLYQPSASHALREMFSIETQQLFKAYPQLDCFSWPQAETYSGQYVYFQVFYEELRINGQSIELEDTESKLGLYIKDFLSDYNEKLYELFGIGVIVATPLGFRVQSYEQGKVSSFDPYQI